MKKRGFTAPFQAGWEGNLAVIGQFEAHRENEQNTSWSADKEIQWFIISSLGIIEKKGGLVAAF